MYNYKHDPILQGGSDPDAYSKNDTVLTATFSFGKEVSPNQKKEIERRCSLFTMRKKLSKNHYEIFQGLLHEFITNTLGYAEESRANPMFGRAYLGSNELLKVSSVLFCSGFKLKSTAEGYLPLEEMVDLKALNNFVLTGEHPSNVDRSKGSCLSLP